MSLSTLNLLMDLTKKKIVNGPLGVELSHPPNPLVLRVCRCIGKKLVSHLLEYVHKSY